jgi:hypothetical protein
VRNGLRLGVAGLAALSLIATASPAAASEAIGRLAPAPTVTCTGSTNDFLQPTVTTGTGYVVPALPGASALVISSWSHNAANAPGPLTFKVFRKVADPATYMVVGHDGAENLMPSALNTFQTDIPVQAGDVIGINSAIPASTACNFADPGERALNSPTDLFEGQSADFMPGTPDRSLNVSAVVSPSNVFTLSYAKYDKRHGTARLNLRLPNPGTLVLSGKGVRSANGPSTRSIGAPGPVKLLIGAKGPQRKRLARTGRVKVRATVTFTPTGGSPRSLSLKLGLRLQS